MQTSREDVLHHAHMAIEQLSEERGRFELKGQKEVLVDRFGADAKLMDGATQSHKHQELWLEMVRRREARTIEEVEKLWKMASDLGVQRFRNGMDGDVADPDPDALSADVQDHSGPQAKHSSGDHRNAEPCV